MTDSNGGDGPDRDPPPSARSDDGRDADDAASEDVDAGEGGSDEDGSDPNSGADERSVDAEQASAGGDEASSDGETASADGDKASAGGDEAPADGNPGVEGDGSVEPNGGESANPGGVARTTAADKPAPEADASAEQPIPDPSANPIGWFRRTDNEAVIVFKDVASSVGIVLVIGLVLFGISGVWPPLVAIESGSMNPHMQKGDLVFIMEEDRLTPDAAVEGTGVVTYQQGKEAGYRTFGSYGDVIVFQPNGGSDTPIIHRAMFYVEEGENWYEKANKSHIQADSCEEINACSAPHSGFVTKGDNPRTNQQYDQVDRYQVVKPEWIQGTAEVRLPWLGCIRLEFSGTASCRPLFGTAQPASPGMIGDQPTVSARTAIAAPRS
ncbi:S26 family signal peptidase [Natronoarchaeum mannanilyticum]|uniref:S26 family signal peptidase n=1 Tax=Natronoarchaeum mannanilyticum TaxID=926360 RepID=A0AAV3T8P6_9EURY